MAAPQLPVNFDPGFLEGWGSVLSCGKDVSLRFESVFVVINAYLIVMTASWRSRAPRTTGVCYVFSYV